MIVVPAGVKVHLALGHTDIAKRARRTCHADPGASEEGPVLGPSVRLPRQECFALENLVLGWDGPLSLHQTHGSRKLFVAAHGGTWRHGDTDAGAARDADRGHRLAHTGTLLATAFGRMKMR